MKKILLTGAAGFIGYHVALALHSRGDFVIGLDNFNDYYDPSLKQARSSLLHDQGIEILKADINNKDLLLSLFKKNDFTDVVHLAAQAGVRYSQKNPTAYIESNISGFVSILELLRLYPNIKLTYASSSSVYGCNEKLPFSEKDITDTPSNLYAATKKAGELIAYSYHHLYSIRMTGLRFFTVYGPWGRPDMAYFMFTKAIMDQEPIHIFNNGKMSRDFTYIDDIVFGTLAAIDYGKKFDIFNLGGHQPVNLLDFVSLLEKIIGKKAIKLTEKESKGEVLSTYADISHAQNELSFHPKTTLENGLTNFVKWYVENRW